MTSDAFFTCDHCGGQALALSHTWRQTQHLEEVGFAREDGSYAFADAVVLNEAAGEHEWIAYCGDCGHGVSVEWLDEGRIRLIQRS